MIRRNLKLLSFILLPITHLLIPPVSLILSLITLMPWFLFLSFIGYPMEPWTKIEKIRQKVYKRFTEDIKKFAENYGHESGIPQNWDGRVYGKAL